MTQDGVDFTHVVYFYGQKALLGKALKHIFYGQFGRKGAGKGECGETMM